MLVAAFAGDVFGATISRLLAVIFSGFLIIVGEIGSLVTEIIASPVSADSSQPRIGYVGF